MNFSCPCCFIYFIRLLQGKEVETLEQYLMQSASCFNTVQENFYHGMVFEIAFCGKHVAVRYMNDLDFLYH